MNRDPRISPQLDAELKLTRTSVPAGDRSDSINLVTLRGPWAVLALVAVVATLVINALYHRSELSPAESAAVSRGLDLHYRFGRSSDQVTAEDARVGEVTIVSGASKGWWSSRVVRVDVSVSGEVPPDGKTRRYLRVSCLVGCVVMSEASRLEYGLGLWFVESDVGSFP